MQYIPEKFSEMVGLRGVKAVCAQQPPHHVLLGLDSGKKRWGIAISDDALRVALPLLQYTRQKYDQDFTFLAKIVHERRVGGFILGLPLHMNAELGARAQAALQLGWDIQQKLSLSVAFWDERMSSVAMQRVMIEEADLSRRKQQKSLDKLSAHFILQGALDAFQLSGKA